MGTFLVVAGSVRFPSASALDAWKRAKVDGATVGAWAEPLDGPAGEAFDGLTVDEALARATAADFSAGRVAVRTDGLCVTLAAGLEEGDGIAIWAPLLVAAARRASTVKGKGELIVGYADEEARTRVQITARGSRMAPLDDEALAQAHDAVTPAVELYTGARTELDPPVEPDPKANGKTKAKTKTRAAPPVPRPLRWRRVVSGVTSSLFALARARSSAVWAAGDGGALTTGPLEGPWVPVATGVTTAFYDVITDGERRVWAAGYEVVRSDDAGRTFVRCTPAGATAAMTSIWAAEDRAVCVDAVGCIRLSTDAGVSWTVVHTDAAASSSSRVREGDGALWAVGTSGVLVSRDRGATFEPVPAETASYVDVIFARGARLLVAYDRIFSGEPPVEVGPKHHRDVDFRKASVSGPVIWVVHQGVIRSEDGGATWEQTYPRDSDFPFAVLGLGPKSALIVGPRGSAWLAT
jgi:hypothetical protein